MVAKMNKTAMLVIDMQKDFILPGKPLQVAGGQAIIPNVIKAVEVARESGILVVWVVREHDPMGRDVELYRMPMYGEGKESPVSLGNVGSELVEGLEIKKGDYKLVKTRFSAFFGTNLHSFLQRVGINSLVVTGVQTPNCVRQTVIEALELDYDPITVITDASAAATPEVHAANLYDMKKVGIATPTLKEWCKSIA
ncbi:probable inactive nicotinamidase At3g16190 isoform X1 [Macadamia integrifolia]|uniref:probable inactive nicotinamidase At3g16190 isoform X1 n=1 Tax=Macadamia integrifolia TaxID=60698 RepID=UPI001C4F425A|nr:probable inactive nicotinamidase At3g16190 isoform X1 [Macadamia integrifolia]